MFLEDIVSALDLTKACFFLFFSLFFFFFFFFLLLSLLEKKNYYIGRRKEIDPSLFKELVFVHFS